MTPGSGRRATYLVTACTACFAGGHYYYVLGMNGFLPIIICSRVLFWGRIFFGRSLLAGHYFQQGVMFWDDFFCRAGRFLRTNFLGPTGQEAKAKTVIIYGIAVTASQFLVIAYFR